MSDRVVQKKSSKYDTINKPKEWIGLKPRSFWPYRKYINREKPGICGTYVSAALIHYMINRDTEREIDLDSLLTVLNPIIDQRHFYFGTYPWDLTAGINDFLDENSEYRAKWHVISNPIVLRELSKPNPLPVIVGTLKLLGNKYGNHWLLVYAYGYNKSGQLFYKGYDNHGKVAAVIPASQTASAVWLEQSQQV